MKELAKLVKSGILKPKATAKILAEEKKVKEEATKAQLAEIAVKDEKKAKRKAIKEARKLKRE